MLINLSPQVLVWKLSDVTPAPAGNSKININHIRPNQHMTVQLSVCFQVFKPINWNIKQRLSVLKMIFSLFCTSLFGFVYKYKYNLKLKMIQTSSRVNKVSSITEHYSWVNPICWVKCDLGKAMWFFVFVFRVRRWSNSPASLAQIAGIRVICLADAGIQ